MSNIGDSTSKKKRLTVAKGCKQDSGKDDIQIRPPQKFELAKQQSESTFRTSCDSSQLMQV